MTGARDYWLYGLRVRSELDLPELPAASGSGEPDVQVKFGAVNHQDGGDGEMRGSMGGASIAIAGTAQYAIESGTTIVVDREKGAPDRNVRLFLLGSAMGMLVHQRGLLPLHANTILIGNRAVAFMGHSGSGKSTLAAWFHDQGHQVVGDDVCVVRIDGPQPTASSGLPRLRLWRSSLEATGRDHSAYPLSYTGDEGFDKYDVALDRRLPPQREIALAAIYDLAKGNVFSIRPLSGLAAADAVIGNTYRGEYVALAGSARQHWEACVRLAQQVPVFRLERPWDLVTGQALVERIVEHSVILTSVSEHQT